MTSQVVPMPNPQDESRMAVPSARSGSLATILGMYAFAAATFIVAAHMAHWYGNAQSAIVLFPLVLFFGGLAQFYACAWAFRTGDATAVAMHGSWGAFWTAYGVLGLMFANGHAAGLQGPSSELGFWFIAIAAITWAIAAGSRGNKGITTLLVLLAIGATLEAIGELAVVDSLRILAGYFMIAASIVAWFVASAVMMRLGRTVKSQMPAKPVAQSESVHAA
jgi:uncharacterized protein